MNKSRIKHVYGVHELFIGTVNQALFFWITWFTDFFSKNIGSEVGKKKNYYQFFLFLIYKIIELEAKKKQKKTKSPKGNLRFFN